MVRVTVPWQNQNNHWWNETCAQVVGHFGLLGGKYVTEVSSECMHFDFQDERDALLCKIMISDKI